MPIDLTAPTVEETRAIGAALAPLLRPGDVISLTGELGAGKTNLVQGAAAALGVTGGVVSPTFTLVREYHDGSLPIYHLDVYRLNRVQDVIDLGFEEMVDAGGVTFIEWGDAIEGLLAGDYLRLDLATAGAGSQERRIRITPAGPSWTGRESAVEAAVARWRAVG